LKFRFILCIFFISFYSTSQDSINPVKTIDTILEIAEPSNRIVYNKIIAADKEETEINSDFNWQKNMPWIAAIIIGLLTVLANYIISDQNRKLNIEVSEKELENSKEIALAQIANAKEAMELDFNKTVLSGNRQLWIKDFREIISLILSKTMTKTLKKNISADEYESFKFLLIKAELMLDPIIDKEIIVFLTEFENCCLEILMENKELQELEQFNNTLINITQIKLEKEWSKVKSAE